MNNDNDIKVIVQQDTDAIIVKTDNGATTTAWQQLILNGDKLSITGGNTITLPAASVDLTVLDSRFNNLDNQITVLNNRVDSTNKAINNLPVPLSEDEIEEIVRRALPDMSFINRRFTDNESTIADINNRTMTDTQRVNTLTQRIDGLQNRIDRLPDISNIAARLATAEAYHREITDNVATLRANIEDEIFNIKEKIKGIPTESKVQQLIDAAGHISRSDVQSMIDTAVNSLPDAESTRY